MARSRRAFPPSRGCQSEFQRAAQDVELERSVVIQSAAGMARTNTSMQVSERDDGGKSEGFQLAVTV